MTDPRPPARPPPDEPVSVGYARRTTTRHWAIPPVWIIVVLVLMVPLALVYVTPMLWKRPKTPPLRASCASNLRGIGQGVLVFANDHDGELPEDFQALIDDGCLEAQHLVSPLSGNRQPACDYYYVTGLTREDPPDWIVAYADPAYRNGIGANVLYLDGHVEFVKEPEFSQQLQRFKATYEQDRGEPPTIIPPH